MRSIVLIVSAVLLGSAIGTTIATARVKYFWPWDGGIEGLPQEESQDAPPVAIGGNGPKVEVDQPVFEFGVMGGKGAGEHEFVLTNVGTDTLTLAKGETSCSCAVSELRTTKLEPGESTKVLLEWKAADLFGPYRQTANISTNDPDNPIVTLTVSGRVLTAVRVNPTDVVFSRITADEGATATTRIFGYLPEPNLLQIKSFELSDPLHADLVDVKIEPLPAEELREELDATAGYIAHIRLKPGLPLGAFRQKILIQTNLEDTPTVEIPIRGLVGSDISLVGQGWDESLGVLTLGSINSQEGIERSLLLVVRGNHNDNVTFKLAEVYPDDLLDVEIGQTTTSGGGSSSRTPLKIKVPPGSHPANHLGPQTRKMGRILLDTNHPKAPQVKILVRFAVQG
jgi:hypothetical protein